MRNLLYQAQLRKKRSHMYMLNSKVTKTNLCSTLIRRSSKLLKDELILVVYFQVHTKLEIV